MILKTGKRKELKKMKKITVNEDGTKSIKRSVIMGTGNVPMVRLFPDMGLKKDDVVEVTMNKKGDVTIRKLK